MKTFVQLTFAVSLAATAVATPSHRHGHRHLHAKKDATKVDKRDPSVFTQVVAAPVATVYKLGDDILDNTDAEKGLEDGEYIVIGESTPTYTPPPAPTTTKDLGGQFIESKSTTSTPPPPPPPPKTTSTPPPPKSTPAAPVANAAFSDDDSSGGEDAEFPSGKIKCSTFPSKYGAVAADWLGFDKWLGLQVLPDFGPGVSAINNIITGITGDTCKPGTMCSYACKPGYQKSQWPQAQGLTGQSIGGLWCNSDGYLELTRPEVKQICIPGQGGVFVKNELNQVVTLCRTDYPGTEGMYIPTEAQPGQTLPVTNPSQSSYYSWQGKMTSAQYYINPAGMGKDKACIWGTASSTPDSGNWAALNAGVGQAPDGTTFVSVFLNKPTSNASPTYNVAIEGGNSVCKYENGQWYGGDGGCTTGVAPGGKATIRYY